VKSLGFVNDNELRTLYENAACFVFPSFYEGFGLPPLEAIAVGCPVVIARAASLPEVFGDVAAYCDPYSPLDIARRISYVLQGERPSRESLWARAARFTWEDCALKTWSILLEALSRFN
jgi:glycosyltransferase involved in cell wall biosynthesis